MSECVFCSRRDQPASLFESESLHVRPDKYPMIAGHSPVLWEFQRLLEEWTGAKKVDGDWIKPTTPEDVAEVGRRWESWAG